MLHVRLVSPPDVTGRLVATLEAESRVVNLVLVAGVARRIVAVLAGIAGVVSMTESRANTLIGVFISVTTIPAAADIAVSVAFRSWSEAEGSALQLILNVVLLVVVGAAVLILQRWFWRSRGSPPRAP